MPSRTWSEAVAAINAGNKVYYDRGDRWISSLDDLPTEDEWNTARAEDLQGLLGNQGPAGSTWRNGTIAPSNSLGVDGDYYLRTSNGDLYHKASGAYTVVGNIKGPTGATGATGAPQTLAALLTGLPTTDPHVIGSPWLNAGVLTVSAG